MGERTLVILLHISICNVYRIGFGIDFHQLAEGRDLVIGGITIPHHKGSLGHSDADVLLHAICDAMLGALALGDIGMHFPNSDPAYKGIDSKILLDSQAAAWPDLGFKTNGKFNEETCWHE